MNTAAIEHEETFSEAPDKESIKAQHPGRPDAADRRWSLFQILWRSSVMYGVMVLCFYDIVPAWAVWVTNLLMYFRVYAEVHDLGHAWSLQKIGWPARFVPVANPIWGGVQVFSTTHRGHHQYLGTDKDPWLPYYAGHPLKALAYTMIEPERNLYCFVKKRGVTSEVVKNVLYNLAFFAINVTLFKGTYLMHVASQRLTHVTASFVFNFYTHRQTFSADAPISTFNRERDLKSIVWLLRLLWGNYLAIGLTQHNRHHVIGQAHVPGLKYHTMTDMGSVNGAFTRYTKTWPLTAVQRLSGDVE